MAAFFLREEPDGSSALFLSEERGVFLFYSCVVVGGGLKEAEDVNDGNYGGVESDENSGNLLGKIILYYK